MILLDERESLQLQGLNTVLVKDVVISDCVWGDARGLVAEA